MDMDTRHRRAKIRTWTRTWIRTECDMDMVFDIDDIHVLFKREFWHACFNGKLFNAYSIFLICNATFNAHIAFRQRFNFRSLFLQEKSTDNFQSYLRCQRTTFSAFNLRDAHQQATSTVDFYPLNGKNCRKLFLKETWSAVVAAYNFLMKWWVGDCHSGTDSLQEPAMYNSLALCLGSFIFERLNPTLAWRSYIRYKKYLGWRGYPGWKGI
jgi:hypothetical protein